MTAPTATDTALAAWRRACSLTDLAGLTAAWLDGSLAAHPGWAGGPDPETSLIADELVALNRRGWLTIDSQPGYDRDAAGNMQRHAVKLILSEGTAVALSAAAAVAGFLCSVPTPLAPLGAAWDDAEEWAWAQPVLVSATAAGGGLEGSCWFGTGPGPDWVWLFGDGADDLTEELRTVLETDATVVAAAAPEWGAAGGGLWDWLLGLAADPTALDAHRETGLAGDLAMLLGL